MSDINLYHLQNRSHLAHQIYACYQSNLTHAAKHQASDCFVEHLCSLSQVALSFQLADTLILHPTLTSAFSPLSQSIKVKQKHKRLQMVEPWTKNSPMEELGSHAGSLEGSGQTPFWAMTLLRTKKSTTVWGTAPRLPSRQIPILRTQQWIHQISSNVNWPVPKWHRHSAIITSLFSVDAASPASYFQYSPLLQISSISCVLNPTVPESMVFLSPVLKHLLIFKLSPELIICSYLLLQHSLMAGSNTSSPGFHPITDITSAVSTFPIT